MQNLISRGIYKTKISAIRCVKELDAGDVYMKQELDLLGGAEEIFVRASRIIFEEMIPWIIENKSVPKPQQGEPVEFKRRKPHEGNISSLKTLDEVFDYIRMLDAEGYPPAFLETENLRLEFSRPKRSLDSVFADVKISKKAE